MTVLGIDDTDSREKGMCTTFVATRLAERFRKDATVHGCYLIRLNPAIKHKTRGNAALAIHTDVSPDTAFDTAEKMLSRSAILADSNTHPGVVIAPGDPTGVPEDVRAFADATMRKQQSLCDALALIDSNGYQSKGWKTGRGRIGALAAIGATTALQDPTYECIAYRKRKRWGTSRRVNNQTVFRAATEFYPDAWDTVDRVQNETVCVPNTPGPVLFGIRGESPAVVEELKDSIDSEPIESSQVFITNQGTDSHLHQTPPPTLENKRAYRLTGTVQSPPTTKQGGHVFFTLTGEHFTLQCVAFEPTKHFRTHVRKLRSGDQVTVCGEISDSTVKLEKFAVRELNTTTLRPPCCPQCDRTMESAGSDQGYRCRDCRETAPQKVPVPVERTIELGWYEVPPCARRHIAKPLIRGGFDAPTHPEL